MDRLICASLSHTHYWYEVGMLKVKHVKGLSGTVWSYGSTGYMVANPARGQLNREKQYFPVRVRA